MKPEFSLWRTFFILLLAVHLSAKETIMLQMRDGVKLATDIHKPEGAAKLPVILSRTPYNKNGSDAIDVEAIKRGFIFVAQDCRGRFASEGCAFASSRLSRIRSRISAVASVAAAPSSDAAAPHPRARKSLID